MLLRFRTFLSKINVFDLITCFLFGLSFLSIPVCSFIDGYHLITWALSILLLCTVVAYLFFHKVRIDYLVISLSLFIISAIIASALSGFKNFAFTPIFNTIFIIIMYLFCKERPAIRNKLITSAFIALIIFALIFVVRYRQELFSLDFDRLGSKFGDINDIAIILFIGFLMSFYKTMFAKKWYVAVLYILLSGLFIALCFASGSKISLILVLGAVIFIVFFRFGKKKWYISTLVTCIIVGATVVLINLPVFSELKDRFLNMIYTFFGARYKNYNYDFSSVSRFEMIVNAFSLFLRRPVFGHGINGFLTYSDFNGWSHNHIAESLCNYGIVGTVLYHIPIVLFFRHWQKEYKFSCILLMSFCLSCLSIALFGEKFYSYLVGILFSYSIQKDLYSYSFFGTKSKKYKIGIIGHFSFKTNAINGQTIKTKVLAKLLKGNYGAENIIAKDTAGGILALFKLPLQLVTLIRNCEHIFILPAHRGVKVIVPLITLINKNSKIHYCVVGGWLPKMIEEKRIKTKYLQALTNIFVETVKMETSLKHLGLDNVSILRNFKDSKPINKGDFIFHDDGPFRVCVFSRIMKEKGIEDAINAVVDINKKSKNHRILLDIYGQIDKKQIEWFERLRGTFPDYITYKGEIDNRDTNHILKNYYLTLFPTHFYTEGIPGTVIDSLFAGVPVLASNWENFDDILEEGYNGYSFQFNNYEDFLDKLVWCLNNPKIINKMKYNCLQSADHFSSTEAIQTIKKVVDRTYGK